MQYRLLALVATICLLIWPVLASADDAAPAAATDEAAAAAEAGNTGFGFLDYNIGDVVDTKALEAAGFALDPYYDPAVYYSKEDTLTFNHGPEDYRLDLGVLDGKISHIVVEFNTLVPTADGSTLDVRPHYEEIATEIAEQLDATYGSWDHETWEYNSDVFNMSVFDFLSPEYALSMRISTISISLSYTTAEDRETQAQYEEAVGASTPAPEAPATQS